jgi:hypothetical protein
MVTYRGEVRVKQQDGSPASFALIKVFKRGRVCIAWWCWDVDNYQYTVQTDFNGLRIMYFEPGTYRLRAEWRGKWGEWVGFINQPFGLSIYLRP